MSDNQAMNLDKAFNNEVKAVKSMKDRGVIQDYKSSEKAGIVWIKADDEWIEVWNVEDVLDFSKPFNGA